MPQGSGLPVCMFAFLAWAPSLPGPCPWPSVTSRSGASQKEKVLQALYSALAQRFWPLPLGPLAREGQSRGSGLLCPLALNC